MSGTAPLRSVPSAAKAWDVDHVRFRVPNLDAQEAFLRDFGLTTERDGDALLGLASDGTAPYRAEGGAAAFLGFGLRVRDEGALRALAERGGEACTDREAAAVTLRDPNGWAITAVLRDAEMPAPGAPRNEAGIAARGLGRHAPPQGPSEVLRLGHVVLRVADFAASRRFYETHFGLLASDEVTGMDAETVAGAFFRCDRGAQPTDHHSVFLMQSPDGQAQFEHAAFEVRDIDSLMAGHDHLNRAGYQHAWGVGRHVLGAHVFDYWRDPAGFELEHWTDGDVLDAREPAGRHPIPILLGAQWGPAHPMTREQAS